MHAVITRRALTTAPLRDITKVESESELVAGALHAITKAMSSLENVLLIAARGLDKPHKSGFRGRHQLTPINFPPSN